VTKTAQIVFAIIFIALGGLWFLQGGGWVGGSFMSGDRTWLAIGIVVIAAGLALLSRASRR
jgi:hypothetical protein